MTRKEYRQKQRDLARAAARAETEAARRIRAATRKYLLPLAAQYFQTGAIAFPKEALAHDITQAIIEEGRKPAEAARKAHREMEASVAERLGVKLKPRKTAEAAAEARKQRMENAKKPPGRIITLPGYVARPDLALARRRENARRHTDADWKEMRKKFVAGEITEAQWRRFEAEYRAERRPGMGRQSFDTDTRQGTGFRGSDYAWRSAGAAAYTRDPATGRVVWSDLPLEYQFRKRGDLSSRVWKVVEEQEQMVMDVLRGGIAAGRDSRQIAGDLETMINYKDGGKRVAGRWMGMFPDTEKGRRQAWEREYLKERGGLQFGSDGANALLYQLDESGKPIFLDKKGRRVLFGGEPVYTPAAEQYMSGKMSAKTKRGNRVPGTGRAQPRL
ncbi:MAG: hypothetical protein FWG66_14135 [Spirochaetes bacterium]|nr:hypothetical protein [Spirochaetota bacterium]